MIQTQKHTKL